MPGDIDSIGAALETSLTNMPQVPPLAWENLNYKPVDGVAYLSTFLLLAEPDDAGFKDSPFIQRGYLQINLHYPTNIGPGAARLKAKDLRRYFARGTSLEHDGVTTVIDRTPEITGGAVEDGRYVMRVRVRFYAHIDPTA